MRQINGKCLHHVNRSAAQELELEYSIKFAVECVDKSLDCNYMINVENVNIRNFVNSTELAC